MSDHQAESADDPRMIGPYRTISAWAIVALVVSLVSGITIINQDLLFLSLVSIAVALIACIRVGFSRNEMLGGSLALFALGLAGFVLASGYCYSSLWKARMYVVARKNADIWLGLVRDGEIYRPLQFLREYPNRLPASTDLEEYYTGLTSLPNQQEDSIASFNSYIGLEPEVSMRKHGHKMTFEFVRAYLHRTRMKSDVIYLEYLLRWPAESGREDWPIIMVMQRMDHNPPIGPQWSVVGVEPLPDNSKFDRKMLRFSIEN